MRWIKQAHINHIYDFPGNPSLSEGLDLQLLMVMMYLSFRMGDREFLPVAYVDRPHLRTKHWVVRDRDNNLIYFYNNKAKGVMDSIPLIPGEYSQVKPSVRKTIAAQLTGKIEYGATLKGSI